MVKKTEKSYKHIERRYVFTSRELKKKLGIEGEINNVILWKGRSPNDIEKGKSADLDEWEINTTEQGFDGETDKVSTKVQVKQKGGLNSSQP